MLTVFLVFLALVILEMGVNLFFSTLKGWYVFDTKLKVVSVLVVGLDLTVVLVILSTI